MTDPKPSSSPIGRTATEAAAGRYERSAAYREQHDRLVPYRVVAEAVILGRGRKHMTQDELGRAIGTTGSAISRVESGTHAVAMSTLAKLGEVLGISFVLGSDQVADAPNVVFVPLGATAGSPKARPAAATKGTTPSHGHPAAIFAESR